MAAMKATNVFFYNINIIILNKMHCTIADESFKFVNSVLVLIAEYFLVTLYTVYSII